MKRTTIQAANTSSAAQPTAEDVMAEFNASVPEQDRPAAARRLLAALDRIHPEDRPISAAVLWTLPLDALLKRAGMDLQEVQLAELPDSLRDKFNGMLLQRIDGVSMLVMPAGQDPEQRDQIARQLIWRNQTEPVTQARPIHLPGEADQLAMVGTAPERCGE